MRTIDGVKYISVKEYAEIKEISVGRVSQLKQDLPVVKFEEFGIELINFELISLSDTEKTLAQTKFQTSTPIHELSYKELGNYFGNFIMDLTKFKSTADLMIDDLQTKVNELSQDYRLSKNENIALSNQVSGLEIKNQNLASEIDQHIEENRAVSAKFEGIKELYESEQSEKESTFKELEDLRIVHNQNKHEFEIKIIENKGLSVENESLKSQISLLETSLKNYADYRTEIREIREFITQKKN